MSESSSSSSLKSLESYRSAVDAASFYLSEGIVSKAFNQVVVAMMHLLNFAENWYRAQMSESTDNDDENISDYGNLRVSDERVSMAIHLLLSRRICDLTGKAVALNVQRRVMSRDSILTKVLSNKKISDTSPALLFRLENVTAAFSRNEESSKNDNREGFPEGMPDSLYFIDETKNGGYAELKGVDEQVKSIDTHIRISRKAKSSTVVMLHGPPGTGKTSLVVAAAKENDMTVVAVTVSNLGGHFIGEREQNTNKLFDYLEGVTSDFILFVDEADSFLPATSENNSQVRLTRVLTINRVLDLVKRNTKKTTRVVILASNYADRIAQDIAAFSFKVHLPAPSTYGQMNDLFVFYRKRFKINMTHNQLDYLVRTALSLKYSPAHVSLLMQRFLTSSLIKLLNNNVLSFEVAATGLEEPVYAVNQDVEIKENDNKKILMLFTTNEPPAVGNDVKALLEPVNSIAFPILCHNVDYQSLVGGHSNHETMPAPVPPVDGELGLPLGTVFQCDVGVPPDLSFSPLDPSNVVTYPTTGFSPPSGLGSIGGGVTGSPSLSESELKRFYAEFASSGLNTPTGQEFALPEINDIIKDVPPERLEVISDDTLKSFNI